MKNSKCLEKRVEMPFPFIKSDGPKGIIALLNLMDNGDVSAQNRVSIARVLLELIFCDLKIEQLQRRLFDVGIAELNSGPPEGDTNDAAHYLVNICLISVKAGAADWKNHFNLDSRTHNTIPRLVINRRPPRFKINSISPKK